MSATERRAARLGGAALASLACACCCGTAPKSQFPTADDALARMHATYACVNGVQGTSKIDHFSPQGRVRGEVYLFAVNPDRVRFDVVSPFGVALYTLTSDGDKFQMLDVKEKQFLFGPSTPCNLARLTQVPVPGHALVSLLRGEAPVLVHDAQSASISFECPAYKIALTSKNAATEEIRLEVSPDDVDKPWQQQRVRVTEVLVSQGGVDLYHAELSNFERAKTAPPRVDDEGVDADIPPIGGACDAELPRSIRMRVPNTQEDVIFQYKEAKWNPPLMPGTFAQVVPGGVTRRFVDCGK